MLINEQTTPIAVPNFDERLPSVSTTDLINLMRVDKTLGNERLAGAISNAYNVINGELDRLLPHLFFGGVVHTNACCPPRAVPQIDINSAHFVHLYRQAVLHETTAQLNDLHSDFDTIGNGLTRTDVTKSDSLRRQVQHLLADMTGRPRNRVRLL